MNDIIATIDELIDDQLDAGEPANGFDFGDPDYPRCPHCGRHWHGLPLTERIANMYAWGRYDNDYRVDTDDSTVLCPGSDFIGPRRPTSTEQVLAEKGSPTTWRDVHFAITIDPDAVRRFREAAEQINAAMRDLADRFARSMMQQFDEAIIFGNPHRNHPCTLYPFYQHPRPFVRPEPEVPDDLTIEFGPQNWHYEAHRIPPPRLQFPRNYWTIGARDPLADAVAELWPHFTATETHTPEPPGYDFTSYNQDQPNHPGWDNLNTLRGNRNGRRR